MACVSGEHGYRFGLTGSVEGEHGYRFSLLDSGALIEGDHGFRFGLETLIEGSHGYKFGVDPVRVYEVYVDPPLTNSGGGPSGLITPSPISVTNAKTYRDDFGYQVTVHREGATRDLTPYIRTGQISQRVSIPATLTLQCADPDRIFRPKKSSGLFSGYFKGDSFGLSFGVREYIEVKLWAQGSYWVAPYFLVTDADWKINNEGERVFEIQATDYSLLLLQDDQQLEDFVSDDASVYYTHTIFHQIASHYDIRLKNEATSFPVRQFSPKGSTALDYFKKLLYVTQDQFLWDKDTLIFEPIGWKSSGSARWRFVDVHDIINLSYKFSSQNLKNEFVLKKVEKAGVPLAVVETSKYGFSPLAQLDPPSAGVDAIILDANYGFVNYFNYYNAQNQLLTPSGSIGPYRGSANNPAAYVEYVYHPVENPALPHQLALVGQYANGRPPYAAVEFWGLRRHQIFGPLDEGFGVHYKLNSSQTQFGERRDRSPIENPLIPTKAYALRLARSLAVQSMRQTQISNWTGILNPWLRPNETIAIKCGQAGFTTPTNFYVESVTKRFGANGEFTMDVECTGDQA